MNEHKKIYETKRWQIVRQQVINRDRDICQKCGKFILKKRTIHHIIELTDENYTNDAIAYGLDNLQELCFKCHNNIHEKGFNDNKYVKNTIVDDELNIDYSKRKGQK